MQPTIQYIRKELLPIYPPEEVEGIIKLLFWHLKRYTLTDMVLSGNNPLTPAETDAIQIIVNRLKQHEPIQYITGESEFYGLKLKVNREVLIPRPETEELIGWIISMEENPPAIADIGTGSGNIALSLKKAFPESEVTAADFSPEALRVAEMNANANQLSLHFFLADILQWNSYDWPGPFDVVASNPPYVRESEMEVMRPEVVDFEPHHALFVPDTDALKYYRALADFSIFWLKPGGKIYCEINESLGEETARLFENKGLSGVEIKKDLQGKDRMIKAIRPAY